MKRETVTNIAWTAVATAVLGVLGWLSLSVVQLQNQYAAEAAEKELRQDMTDVMNDVDKRLAVIEAVMVMNSGRSVEPSPPVPAPIPPMMMAPDLLQQDPFAEEEAEEEEAEEGGPVQQAPPRSFSPRYDLRKQSQ